MAPCITNLERSDQMAPFRPSHTRLIPRTQRLHRKRTRLQLATLACGSLLVLAGLAQAAPYPSESPGIGVAPAAFWACTYRDNAPPNWEYVRYIEAASRAEAEARMRAELPSHQSLVGCKPTQS